MTDDTREPLTDKLIDLAIEEDLGEKGDITTDTLITSSSYSRATISSKSTGIVAGLLIAKEIFRKIDSSSFLELLKSDGDAVSAGDRLIEIKGKTSSILKGERLALNFIQHLSGISSITNEFVRAVEGTGALIYDTRKTLPGLRSVEKYAVKMGGGHNHRMGLFDQVLIKDNHLAASKDIEAAIMLGQKKGITEVEVEDLDQLRQAIKAGVDIVMLDNMDKEMIRQAVKIVSGRSITEASGGIDLGNVRDIAETGVDRISIGIITMGAKPLDIALNFDETQEDPF